MDKETTSTIRTFGEALVRDLQAATPSASGQTARSIRLEMTPTGFVVYGPSHIEQLIDGRGPTSPNAKKGNPTVQQQILSWIKSRSISPKDSDMSQESLSWAIAKSIHKNGFKGKGNFYSKVLTDNRFDSLGKMILREKALTLRSSVVKQFKFS